MYRMYIIWAVRRSSCNVLLRNVSLGDEWMGEDR